MLMEIVSLFQKKEEEDEDDGARASAQSVFKVRLIKFDETKKVPVIKQVKDVVENINLVQVDPRSPPPPRRSPTSLVVSRRRN